MREGPDPTDSTPGDAEYCNEGIARDIAYVPELPDVLEPLSTYVVGAGQCYSHAKLLRYILRSIGADGGSVVSYWGGSATEMTWYSRPFGGRATFQLIRPAIPEDGVAANPFFAFHAMTHIGGTVYDPSYGLIGAPNFIKLVPADVDNAPKGNFPEAEDKDWNYSGTLDPAATVQTGPMPPAFALLPSDPPP